jgi:DNA-binding IclR family transcriptional regulator
MLSERPALDVDRPDYSALRAKVLRALAGRRASARELARELEGYDKPRTALRAVLRALLDCGAVEWHPERGYRLTGRPPVA